LSSYFLFGIDKNTILDFTLPSKIYHKKSRIDYAAFFVYFKKNIFTLNDQNRISKTTNKN